MNTVNRNTTSNAMHPVRTTYFDCPECETANGSEFLAPRAFICHACEAYHDGNRIIRPETAQERIDGENADL